MACFAVLAFALVCTGDAAAQARVDAAAAQLTWHVNASGQHTTGYSPMGFALDALGRPHVTFQVHVPPSYKDLMYGTISGGVWQIERVDSGDYVGVSSAIAIQPNGDIAIAYTDDEYAAYAAQKAGHWRFSYVDALADHMFRDIGLGFDASGAPQVGYWDSDANVVKYAVYDAAKDEWTVETVGNGRHARFLVDATGTAHFVYWSDDGRHVHAQGTSIGWTSETLPSGMSNRSVALKGSQICMAYDYAGNPAGLYYRCPATGAEQLIDPNGRAGILAFSPSGEPHVLYANMSTGPKRMIAALHGGQWHREPISPDFGDMVLTRLIIDDANRPHVAFSGNAGVTYAWADGTIVPESDFALVPKEVQFVTHYGPGDTVRPAAAVVTRIGEPASKEDTFDVALQVKGKQDVEWEVKAPPWVDVTPAKGKGPAALRVGLKLKPDEVKLIGKRTGVMSVQSPDGRITTAMTVTVNIAPRRYIDPPATKLIEYLDKGLLYRQAPDPDKSTRPVGSVLIWTDWAGSKTVAHSTVVINETEQAGMGQTVVREPRSAAPMKPSGVSAYTLLAVWEPPMPTFQASRVPPAFLSTSLPREDPDTVRQWNCHGYSATLIYFGYSPKIRASKGASFSVQPSAITVNRGQVWYGGGRMSLYTPLGPFDLQSECTVNVMADGRVEFLLFSGSAVYHGGAGDVSLKPNERIVIASNGQPGPVTVFDPSTIDRWWEWIDVEDYELFLPAVRK